MSIGIRSFRKRGEIVKYESKDGITMERRLLLQKYQLNWSNENCIGCGICADMCPKEAISYLASEFKDGRRVSPRPRVDFDPDKCVMCGECVVVCPMNNALIMMIDGRKFTPVIEENAFAMVTRKTSL